MACFVYQLVSELRLYAVKNSTVYQLLYNFSFEKQAESLVENVCNKESVIVAQHKFFEQESFV